ncbi:ABC transporter permease [Arcanobacterium hippocoleae]
MRLQIRAFSRNRVLRAVFTGSFHLLRVIALLLCVSSLAFMLIANAPIDPLTAFIGAESALSPEARAEIVAHWGLDQDGVQRYFMWLGNVLHGDFGYSLSYQAPVAAVIVGRFTASLLLMISAWLVAGIFGFLLGVICGLRAGSVFDRLVTSIVLALKSAPTFWLGLVILTIFAVILGWFPIGMNAPLGKLAAEVTFTDRLHHLVLPAFTLALVSIGDVLLYTREKVCTELHSQMADYARARGESTRQLTWRHILRNVSLPAITVQFASFNELFGGMALAENVFSYPGIGSALTASALAADVPLLLGISVFSAIFVFAGNGIANLLYSVIDPRIRRAHGISRTKK